MKISKLFHWLYSMLMLLPFVALAFNFVRIGLSGEMPITSINDVFSLITYPTILTTAGIYNQILGVYQYLVFNIFGVYMNGQPIVPCIINLLTYWTFISLVYLIFDVLMYVPLLVHRWLDKGIIE